MAIRVNTVAGDFVETHEINVTPFIDVMLVLLVIFMVAAPLATVNVPVKLPVDKAQVQPVPDKPVYVSLQTNGRISVGEQSVDGAELAAAVTAATKGNRDVQLFLRADRSVDYGQLMNLLNLLRDAGYLKIALVGLQGSAREAPRSG